MPINRLYDFLTGATANPEEVDAEFNQLVSSANTLESGKMDKSGGTFTALVTFVGGLTLTGGHITLFQAPTSNLHASTKKYVDDKVAGGLLVPTGAIFPYAGASAPTGYLMCDGTAVSRSTYAALFAVLSTTYGPGDGSTTFGLPDLRGRAPVGENPNGGPNDNNRVAPNTLRGAVGGERNHALTGAETGPHIHSQPVHAHTTPNHSHVLITIQPGQPPGAFSGFLHGNNDVGTGTNSTEFDGGGGATSSNGNENTDSAGSGTGHNTVGPLQIVNYIIKT